MRNLRICTLCLLSIVLPGVSAPAQTVIINGTAAGEGMQLPMMGPGRQMKSGTARIRGRIISADTGSPVRRAQVRVTGPEIASKTAMTDAEGRYEFRDLPAGRFNLTATKSGYVTVQYGQTRPFESGKALELAEAQVLERADIGMPRGSVIAGRILDEFGDPVADANVSAMRSSWSGGKRRLQPTGRVAQTNDLGQYRIYGLPPGDYYVSATLRGSEGMLGLEMAMAMTTGSGGGMAGPAPSGSNPNSGYAPTYFPGTTVGADATKLTIAIGQDAQGTDFALLPVKLAKITGTVISGEGKPADGSMVNAVPRVTDNLGIMIPSAARTDKNGNFTLTGVAPGEYNLQTRAMSIMSTGDGNVMQFTARIGGPEGGDAEFGSVPVSVAGEDVSGVIVLTSKGATATGHVTFDGGSKPSTGATLRIAATPMDGDGGLAAGGSGAVKPDGTFELKGLAGGRLLRATNLPPGWILKSVTANGVEITDTGMEFKTGDAVTGIEVTLTSKATELNGTVKSTGSEPVKDFTLVVFSEDPQRWTLPMNRYVTGIRPDQEGRFVLKNLPAGGYYVVALDYIAQGEWGDPDVLDRLKNKATRVSIRDGDTRTLDLKLASQ